LIRSLTRFNRTADFETWATRKEHVKLHCEEFTRVVLNVAPSTAAVKAVDILPDDDEYEDEEDEDWEDEKDEDGEDGEDEEEEDREDGEDEEDEEGEDEEDKDRADEENEDREDEEDEDGADEENEDREDEDEEDQENEEDEEDQEDEEVEEDDEDEANERLICMTRANQNNDIITQSSEHLPASESINHAPGASLVHREH
jgi:hypothetical protein